MKNIVIRVDSSVQIGTGHVMRCLTLAEKLRGLGAEILFICQELQGDFTEILEKKGFEVKRIANEGNFDWETDSIKTIGKIKEQMDYVDWVIVDHYLIDYRWENRIRGVTKKVMVIDDLASRAHDCDLILDQNMNDDLNERYAGLTPKHCKKFLGPSYALLRTEFLEARKKLRFRDGMIKNVLVSFGGTDPTGETLKVLEFIQMYNMDRIIFDIVVGSQNRKKDEIEKKCLNMKNIVFHYQVNDMADLTAKADLAIGAGGISLIERCFLGLPSLIISVADNQISGSLSMAKLGVCQYLGSSDLVKSGDISAATIKMMENPDNMVSMGKKALSLLNSRHVNEMYKVLLED
jgi:UDP-2,4-diacetamido-2,4,6-trideoxy-beta-L-altropyranose hydrolase